MFSFDPDKVDWGNEIGRSWGNGIIGSNCSVYPYKSSPEDDRFVLKHAKFNDNKKLTDYIQEIVLGFSFKHENVLPIRGYHIEYDHKRKPRGIYIKLDRMSCSLESRIVDRRSQGKSFSQKEIINYLYQLSSGLEYLHNQTIAHRDIKPNNILISENEELKITGSVINKFVGDETSELVKDVEDDVHPLYLAPEVFWNDLKNESLFKIDIWSLGMLMARLCLLVEPIKPEDNNAFCIAENLKGLEGKIYDKFLVDLILSMIQVDPTQRKSLQDIQKLLKEKYPNFLPQRNGANENFEDRGDIEVWEDFMLKKEGDYKAEIQRIYHEITDKGVKDLAQRIGSKLKNVEHLSLDFKHCDKINDNGVKELTQQIGSNLQNIRHLSLDLKHCCEITDNGIKELAQQISKLRNIEYLSLDLRRCDKISDDGIKELAQKISKLRNIEHLSLDLRRCNKITDDGVKVLAQQIGINLKWVQHLSLNLNGTSVTQEGRQNLRNYCNFIIDLNI